MGRIKTMLIKRKTREIMAKHSDKLTEDFEKNKAIISQVADVPSKKLRNVIAGYATRLKKKPDII